MNPLHLLWIIPLVFLLGEVGGVFLLLLYGLVVAAGEDERRRGR